MKNTIDQRLLDSQPDNIEGNESFVKRTMQAVGKAGAGETFEKVIRTSSVTKKETLLMKLRNLHKKLKQMPRYAAVFLILGTTGTAGAAAYAAYQWITPEVTITNIQQNNDDNKKQYTVDSQCGEFYSGKALQYEIARNSGLSDEDAYKVFQNTCAYNALETFIASHWTSDNGHEDFAKKKVGDIVTIYQHTNLFAGSTESNPIFGLTIGKVTNITSLNITFELTLYSVDNSAGFNPEMNPAQQPFAYYPNGKVYSRTLTLAPGVEVWENGQMRKLADVKIGDTIQVVTRTQNKVQYYDDIKQNALGEQITFDTVGIIKVDIDTRYVASGIARIGDPKIVNGIAILSPCDNNTEHLCVSPLNQVIGPVYIVGDEFDHPNRKYQRSDMMDVAVKYRRLDGRVTKIEGKHVTLETRGTKRQFTVDMPYDAVAEYNKPKPIMTDYDKSIAFKLEIGDMVQVHYRQRDSEDTLVIKPGDLHLFAILEQVQPDGTITKY